MHDNACRITMCRGKEEGEREGGCPFPSIQESPNPPPPAAAFLVRAEIFLVSSAVLLLLLFFCPELKAVDGNEDEGGGGGKLCVASVTGAVSFNVAFALNLRMVGTRGEEVDRRRASVSE